MAHGNFLSQILILYTSTGFLEFVNIFPASLLFQERVAGSLLVFRRNLFQANSRKGQNITSDNINEFI